VDVCDDLDDDDDDVEDDHSPMNLMICTFPSDRADPIRCPNVSTMTTRRWISRDLTAGVGPVQAAEANVRWDTRASWWLPLIHHQRGWVESHSAVDRVQFSSHLLIFSPAHLGTVHHTSPASQPRRESVPSVPASVDRSSHNRRSIHSPSATTSL
jgi:hypothetical protein